MEQNKKNSDVQEEENAQKAVDQSQLFEMSIMAILLAEFQKVFKHDTPKQRAESLNNINKRSKKEVDVLVPLLIEYSADTLKTSHAQLQKAYKNVVIPRGNNKWHKQIEKEFKKYIKSKGLVINNQSLKAFFTNVCNDQVKRIVEGKIMLDDAIEEVCRIMADKGVSIVTYPQHTGKVIHRNIDVYVRQQLLYAQKESTQDTRYKIAKEMGTTIFEIDAHHDARPSHQYWQGKRFDTTGNDYPTFEKLSNGHGSLDDYGCLHRAYPVLKTDKPAWTDEELKNINTKPFVFDGQKYTGYEAKQKMRQYERQIRALKKQSILMKKANIDASEVEKRLSKKSMDYKRFCKVYGNYPRDNRTRVFTENM